MAATPTRTELIAAFEAWRAAGDGPTRDWTELRSLAQPAPRNWCEAILSLGPATSQEDRWSRGWALTAALEVAPDSDQLAILLAQRARDDDTLASIIAPGLAPPAADRAGHAIDSLTEEFVLRNWEHYQTALLGASGDENPDVGRYEWASDLLLDLVAEDPEAVWEIFVRYLRRRGGDAELQTRAGIAWLEGINARHADDFIDRIEHEASVNPRMRLVMSSMNPPNTTEEIQRRFMLAAAEPGAPPAARHLDIAERTEAHQLAKFLDWRNADGDWHQRIDQLRSLALRAPLAWCDAVLSLLPAAAAGASHDDLVQAIAAALSVEADPVSLEDHLVARADASRVAADVIAPALAEGGRGPQYAIGLLGENWFFDAWSNLDLPGQSARRGRSRPHRSELWPIDFVHRLIAADPDAAWAMLLRYLEWQDDPLPRAHSGIEWLRPLVADHAATFIVRIEREAAGNARLRELLRDITLPPTDDAIGRRLRAAAAEPGA